ncbi:MAG TPA: hypothetical protein VNK23_00890 [Candidatus Dormibacteraeota bacterium]|nr:hypothetical protein [Candidatus Dormibacteraeota bacterium]
MMLLRRIAMAIGGTVVVALVLTLAVPRTAHAVLSALVTVVNNVAVVNPTAAGQTLAVITESADGQSHQPVQADCSPNSSAGFAGDFGCPNMFTVPAGERLVIEYVDASCVSAGQVQVASLDVSFNHGGIGHPLLVKPEGNVFGANVFAVAQPVVLYADPNSDVRIDFSTTDSTGQTGCTAGVTGYLEPTNIQ